MAIRKSVDESLVVDGPRQDWIQKAKRALEQQGFKNVRVSESLGQLSAAYKTFKTRGDLQVTLTPEGQRTRMTITATANVDNVFALGGSPGRKIIEKFKSGLP